MKEERRLKKLRKNATPSYFKLTLDDLRETWKWSDKSERYVKETYTGTFVSIVENCSLYNQRLECPVQYYNAKIVERFYHSKGFKFSKIDHPQGRLVCTKADCEYFTSIINESTENVTFDSDADLIEDHKNFLVHDQIVEHFDMHENFPHIKVTKAAANGNALYVCKFCEDNGILINGQYFTTDDLGKAKNHQKGHFDIGNLRKYLKSQLFFHSSDFF